MPGRQTLEYIPLILATEMLMKGKYMGNDLFLVFIEHCILDVPELQAYILSNPQIPLTISKVFANILLKMPSEVQLPYNILRPHLKYSLSFQLLNMVSNKRTYRDLRMFITFLNKVYISINNNKFLDAISKAIFNLVLLQIFQPRILGFTSNHPVARTTIQYIILILENIESHQLATLFFHFLFGFCGNLPYRYAQPVVRSAQELKVGDGMLEISRIDSDAKSVHDFYSEENSKLIDAVVGIENFLDNQNEPEAMFDDELFSEDKKATVTSRSPDTNKGSPDLIGLPEFVDIKEYSLEKHNPIEISSFVINLLRYEHDGYSNIGLQLFNRLLSFNIRKFYDVLIFSGAKSITCDPIKSLEEMRELFCCYKDLTTSTKKFNLDDIYYIFDISFSDSFLHYGVVENAAVEIKTRPCSKENLYGIGRSSIIPMKRKSWSISSKNSLIKGTDFEFAAAKNARMSSEADINLLLKVSGGENVFIKVICNKLKKMLYNSFDDNLFLSAIILKLFSIPLNPLDEATVVFHQLLIDKNSLMGILKNISDEILQVSDKLPRLNEIIRRRNEIHRKVAFNILTTVSIEDAKTDRFVDVLFYHIIGYNSI